MVLTARTHQVCTLLNPEEKRIFDNLCLLHGLSVEAMLRHMFNICLVLRGEYDGLRGDFPLKKNTYTRAEVERMLPSYYIDLYEAEEERKSKEPKR